MSETGTIYTYERGTDIVVEWRIPYFSTLSLLFQMEGAKYWSPFFYFAGETWFLWIYPNGSRRWNSDHVDLRLWKWSSGSSIRLSFSLSLKTAEGEIYKEEHYTKDFGEIFNRDHEFNRFISRSELTRRSDLLPNDVLTVVCTMKRWTSAGSDKGEASNAEVNKSDVAEASGSSQAGTTTTKESEGEASNAGVNKSSVTEASGSSQAGTTTTKESVLKWIEKNFKVPSKGKKRKTEAENIMKWIEQNYHETSSDAKRRKMAERNDKACTSGSSASPREKKVLQDFKELFLQKEDCDVVIKVKGSEIPAHRAILKAHSPVFASTFRHDMKECATGVVEIEDCEPSLFSDFLYFLYCGDIGRISQGNVFSLYTLADKYEVLDLKTECLDFIRNNMAIDTFCETMTLALQHSETELIASATDFFVENAEEILQTDKWQTFLAQNPTQSNELFIQYVRSVKHSNT